MIVHLRLAPAAPASAEILNGTFDTQDRHSDAKRRMNFIATVIPDGIAPDRENVMRQALGRTAVEQAVLPLRSSTAGSKGDPAGPEPPRGTAQWAQS